MTDEPTERYTPVPYGVEAVEYDTSERVELLVGRVTVALIKLSLVLFVVGLEVIVLLAVYRLLVK